LWLTAAECDPARAAVAALARSGQRVRAEQTLDLPIQRPDVAVPVIELFLEPEPSEG
jgi:hypothetical protein